MKFHIAKVDEVIFSGEADSLTVPAAEGEVTILKDHVPLVTTLRPGTIYVRSQGEVLKQVEVASGILEVSRHSATVLL